MNEPVKRLDGRTGIVDLMLTRQVPTAHEHELEHLVVELKAPKVKIGMTETSQIKTYAFAVRDDERFRGIKTRWTFWLVSNDLDKFAEEEIHQADRPIGVLWQSTDLESRIWVKTWSQILSECRTRLRIFQKELNYSADRDASLEYVKQTYARILEGSPLQSSADEADAEIDADESVNSRQ